MQRVNLDRLSITCQSHSRGVGDLHALDTDSHLPPHVSGFCSIFCALSILPEKSAFPRKLSWQKSSLLWDGWEELPPAQPYVSGNSKPARV